MDKKINREETFALIKEKDSDITLESINEKSDYYWVDVCNNLDITPIYQKKVLAES